MTVVYDYLEKADAVIYGLEDGKTAMATIYDSESNKLTDIKAVSYTHLDVYKRQDYYSERCLEYLTGGNMKKVKVFRWIYILAVFIGPYMTVSAVWVIADIFNGLMALPNMIALFALSGVVAKETREFFKANKHLE